MSEGKKMETQSTQRTVSKGNCEFCKAELAKNKMTQHLKSCKQRLAAISAQEGTSETPKTRMFHILAEGQYNPQYWLHFELPADSALWAIDDFIKDMWIDDFDHLSGFTINGTNYSEANADDFFSYGEIVEEEEEGEVGKQKEESVEEEKEEELTEEEIMQEIRKFVDESIVSFTKGSPSYSGLSLQEGPLSPEWIVELKRPSTVDELIDFLKVEKVRIAKELKPSSKQDPSLPQEVRRARYYNLYYQKLIVEEILEEIEDRTMDVSLARVLKVGQKFSYIYDYGSSTYINLRVLGEREGIVQDQEEPVQLLARNSALTYSCTICGEPATKVAMGYFTSSIAESVFCTKCAKKHCDEGETLPIINSPRVGVL
jgi:hypothetical protein